MANHADPASTAGWIEQLQGAVEAASAEARSAFFYYAGFGLYFALAVAGTSHEDLLRGATVAMPGLGIGMPVVGFYVVVPALFMVFHVYVLLQLVILARRIGWLKLALRARDEAQARRQQILVSPFAINQRLFGEPRRPLPQFLLRLSIWLTLVLIPLGLLLATQLRFLPYHAAGVTWAHRIFIVIDALLLLLLWPAIIHPERRSRIGWLSALAGRMAARGHGVAARLQIAAEALRQRIVARQWLRLPGLVTCARFGAVLATLFAAFVVATVPGEWLERKLPRGEVVAADRCAAPWRIDRWLKTVVLPDDRSMLCVTYAVFEAPGVPFGLRRNIVATAASLVVAEPSEELVAELGVAKAWELRGRGIDLQARDLRFADLSESDLRGADLRGADLQGAVLQRTKLTAAQAGDIERADIGECVFRSDANDEVRCVTRLAAADLTAADLRSLHGFKIDLSGADLTGALLENAQLEWSRLTGAVLTWAQLDGAWLDNASLQGAVLREVSAPEARLNHANLEYAFLRAADLAGASLSNVNTEGADLRGVKRTERRWQRTLSYEVPTTVSDPAEVRLTGELFRRACPNVPEAERDAAVWLTRGVIQRLWHEFEYSRSHDPAGYALVANLRYLLAKLMLRDKICPRMAAMPGRDVCRLQKFESTLKDWRGSPEERKDQALEPDLKEHWDALGELIAALPPYPEAGDGLVTDFWLRLEEELGANDAKPREACPKASG